MGSGEYSGCAWQCQKSPRSAYGQNGGIRFFLRSEAVLKNLTLDIIKSSEIEGEILDSEKVRFSVARRLGMDIGGLVP